MLDHVAVTSVAPAVGAGAGEAGPGRVDHAADTTGRGFGLVHEADSTIELASVSRGHRSWLCSTEMHSSHSGSAICPGSILVRSSSPVHSETRILFFHSSMIAGTCRTRPLGRVGNQVSVGQLTFRSVGFGFTASASPRAEGRSRATTDAPPSNHTGEPGPDPPHQDRGTSPARTRPRSCTRPG